MTELSAIYRRDVALAFRAGGGALQSVFFFGLAALLFALAIGPDPGAMSGLAAPILWAIALLAALISLDRMFEADFEDGSLDAIVETSDMLELSVMAKALAHWTTTSLPVIVSTPLIATLLNLPAEGYGPLVLSLLLGTPALSFLGAIGAGVAVGLRRAAILVSILSVPLFAPTLIFGVGAATAALEDGPAALPSFLFLASITLAGAIIGPIAAAAAIRFNMS